MSSKKGFFCELPEPAILKIRRIARHFGESQGDVVVRALARLTDVKELTGRKAAKVNGQEMLARALVKDSGKFTQTRTGRVDYIRPFAGKGVKGADRIPLHTPGFDTPLRRQLTSKRGPGRKAGARK
jgi:hypothetical protein